MRFLAIFVLLLAVPAFGVMDYMGTEATWVWDQPDNDPQPDSWVVQVSRDGSSFEDELHTVTEKEVTLSGERDQTITLRVAARLNEYRSLFSEESEPVTFRVLDAPTGIAIKCSVPLVELPGSPGWWACPDQ